MTDISNENAKLKHLKSVVDYSKQEIKRINSTLESINTYVTPEMYGAVGDGMHDDTIAINQAMQSEYPVEFSKNKTYLVSGFTISSNIILHGNGAKLLCSGEQQDDRGKFVFYIPQNEENVDVLYDVSISDFNIEILNHIVGVFQGLQGNSLSFCNCCIEGNAENDPSISAAESPGANQGITFYHFQKFKISNNTINDIRGYAISAEEYNSNGIISDNVINNTGRGSIYVRAYNKNIEVARNRITNSVRCFTITDGSIDLYGPGNENIFVNKNYIEGYGRPESLGIGIRLKGSKHVICSENTIVVDENTYSFALVFTQDRNGVGCEDVVIEKNYLYCKGNKSSYIIRDDHNIESDYKATKDLIIQNNYVISEQGMCNVGISIRREINGLSIIGNHIEGNRNPIEFYQSDDFDRNTVLISGNKIFGSNSALILRKINDLTFINNYIQSDNESASLISAVNCNNVFIDANTLINKLGLSIISNSNCTNLSIKDTNTFINMNGIVDLHSYTFLRSISGYSGLEFDSTEGGIVELKVYGYTEQTINDGEKISPENLIEYQSVNDDGDLTLSFNGTTCSDSRVKRGLPLRNSDLATYVDSNGQAWAADYRDWANGVDWHITEEYVLTGDEDVRDHSDDTITIRWKSLENDKKSIGSDYRYYYNMLSNAFKYGLNSTGLSDANADGSVFSISAYNSYFTNAEGFKTMCKTLYEAGTPIKILYLLKEPYTTPIDPEELLIYNQIKILSSGNIASNSMDLYMDSVYLLPDNYWKGTKKLINVGIDEFTSTTTSEIKTDVSPIEIQQGVSININGYIRDRLAYYSVAVFNIEDIISDTVSIRYAISQDTANFPAFVVKDIDEKIVDVVMCESTEPGFFTSVYNIPNSASKIYVNINTYSTDNILQRIEYVIHNKLRDCVLEHSYSKEQIDAVLGAYITDVANLVGGDA